MLLLESKTCSSSISSLLAGLAAASRGQNSAQRIVVARPFTPASISQPLNPRPRTDPLLVRPDTCRLTNDSAILPEDFSSSPVWGGRERSPGKAGVNLCQR